MAEHQYQPAAGFHQLRIEAAQTRLRAIQEQIAIGLTFCSLTEKEFQNGSAGHAREMIEKLRKMCATMRRHLDEPNHVPPDEVGKTGIELSKLESRLLAVEARERDNRR